MSNDQERQIAGTRAVQTTVSHSVRRKGFVSLAAFFIPALSITLFLLVGQTSQSRADATIEEAKSAASGFAPEALKVPPRSVSDVLATFDAKKAVIDDRWLELKTKADRPVPAMLSGTELARFLLRRQAAAMDLGRTNQSLADLEKAAAQLDDVDDQGLRLRILLYAGWRNSNNGNIGRALAFFRQGLEESSGRAEEQIEFRTAISQTNAWGGNIEEARRHLTQAREIYDRDVGQRRDVNERSDIVYRALIAESEAYVFQIEGKWAKALEKWRRVRELLSGHPSFSNSNWLMWSDHHLAKALAYNGRLAEAELSARSTVERAIALTGTQSAQTGWSMRTLANILAEQDRLPEAAEVANRTRSIFAEIAPNSLGQAEVVSYLAELSAASGRWNDVVRYQTQIKEVLYETPDVYQRRFARSPSFALALALTGAPDALSNARARLEELKTLLGVHHYETAEMAAVLGVVLHLSGDLDEAGKAFREGIPVLQERTAQSAVLESSLFVQETRRKQILDLYLAFLADIAMREGTTSKGRSALDEAFIVSQKLIGLRTQHALNAASVRSTIGTPALADLARREQDALVQIRALNALLSSLANRPKEQTTPEIQDRLRDKIELLRTSRLRLKTEIIERFPRYAELSSPKPLSISDLKALLEPNETLLSILETRNGVYVWAVSRQRPVGFVKVAMSTEAIEHAVERLRSALDPVAQTLADIPQFDLSLAHALYSSLLKPVEKIWKDSNVLLVVASGSMSMLPLSVLPTEPPADKADRGVLFDRYKDQPWLARTHAVAYLPSVSSLASLRRLQRVEGGTDGFVGFGDPFFSLEQSRAAADNEATANNPNLAARGFDAPVELRNVFRTRQTRSMGLDQLPRLKDTADEVRNIAKAVGSNPEADIFLGARASEEAVKSYPFTGRRIVVFATHGLVAGDLDGLYEPALALSAPTVTGGREDGLLRMSEILPLRLNAEWVVLSACNTASGDGAGAEAISGLGRAFFYAGAKSLLASHWPVESSAAATLTTELFEVQAKSTNLNKAEALRQAMLALIDGPGFRDRENGKIVFSYAHPLFWAPFSIFGEVNIKPFH